MYHLFIHVFVRILHSTLVYVPKCQGKANQHYLCFPTGKKFMSNRTRTFQVNWLLDHIASTRYTYCSSSNKYARMTKRMRQLMFITRCSHIFSEHVFASMHTRLRFQFRTFPSIHTCSMIGCSTWPGGCFINVSRALQDVLPKFVYCINRTSYENFNWNLSPLMWFLSLCIFAHQDNRSWF